MIFKKIVATVMALLLTLSLVPSGLLGRIDAFAVQGDALATIFTASDFQGGQQITNFTAMLNRASAAGHVMSDGFLFGGDYSNGSSSEDPSAGIAAIRSAIASVYPGANTDNQLFVQGNHDLADADLTASGAYYFDSYAVFVINEDDFPSSQSSKGATVLNTAALLEQFFGGMISSGDTRPVFVITHVPLHHSSRSGYDDNLYAKYLVDVLNTAGQYLDIVFLFGHNHSSSYDDYIGGSVNYIARGQTMRVAIPDTATVGADYYTNETLNFTYSNYGYVGYSGNASSGGSTNTLTMGVFELCPAEIVFTRYSTTGVYNTQTVSRINPQPTSPYVSVSGSQTGELGGGATVYGRIANITSPNPTWTSSDTAIVDILPAGSNAQVIYRGTGTATVTLSATDDNNNTVSDTLSITVTDPHTVISYIEHPAETYYYYELVNAPTGGNDYIIASSNAAGSATAMYGTAIVNSGIAAGAVTVNAGTGVTGGQPYIETSDAATVWRLTTSAQSGFYIANTAITGANTNLRASSNTAVAFSNRTDSSTSWTYSASTRQIHNVATTTRAFYLNGARYNITRNPATPATFYFYEKTPHTTEEWTETVTTHVPYEPSSALYRGSSDVNGRKLKYYEASYGDTLMLNGTFDDFGENINDVTVTWNSSDTGVATVNNGLVTFTGSGETAISYTVTDGVTTLSKSVNILVSRGMRPMYYYRLTDSFTAGKSYVFANANVAGSASIMTNTSIYTSESNQYGGYRLAQSIQTIEADGSDIRVLIDNDTYVYNAVAGSGSAIYLTSDESGLYLLAYASDTASVTDQPQLHFTNDNTLPGATWTLNSRGYLVSDTGYGMHYSSDGNFRAETSPSSVYLYERIEVDPFATITISGANVAGTTRTLYSVSSSAIETIHGAYGNFGETVTQQWISSDEDIATVDGGIVYFTGAEGDVTITYLVTDTDGNSASQAVNYIATLDAEPKMVFKPAAVIVPGKNYIIVSAKAVGAAYVMTDSRSSSSRLGQDYVVIQPDTSDNRPFIEIGYDKPNDVWTAESSVMADACYLKNLGSGKYAYGSFTGERVQVSDTLTEVTPATSYCWQTITAERGIMTYSTTTAPFFYLRHSADGNFRFAPSDTESSNVYVFEEVELLPAVHIRSMYENVEGTTVTKHEVCEWQTERLLAHPVNFNTSDIAYTWSSSNPAVASIDATGVLTYTGAAGSTTVTLTATSLRPDGDNTYQTATASAVISVSDEAPDVDARYDLTDSFIVGESYAFATLNSAGTGYVMTDEIYEGSEEFRLTSNVYNFTLDDTGIFFTSSDRSVAWECIASGTAGYYNFRNLETGEYFVMVYDSALGTKYRRVTTSASLNEYAAEAYRIAYDSGSCFVNSQSASAHGNRLYYNSSNQFRLSSLTDKPIYIYSRSVTSESVTAQIRIDAYGGNKNITNVLQVRNEVYEGMTERLLSYVSGVTDPVVAWSSNNINVASVDNEGLVTYTGQTGFANIIMTVTGTDENGSPVTKTVYTTVSSSSLPYSSPTDDYPDYPNEGSVRINKVADSSVGGTDFQTSGVAEVELEVTGVPMSQPVDVVVVFDHSSSMNSSSRLEHAIAHTKEFALEIVHRNPLNRIAIVTFDKYINNFEHYDSASSDYNSDASSTENRIITGDGTPAGAFMTVDSAESLVTQIQSLQYNDTPGTNYDDGLMKGYEILDSTKNDPEANDKQVLIFMSDGEPYAYNRLCIDYELPVYEAWLNGDETDTTIQAMLADPTTYPAIEYFNTDGNNWIAEAIKAAEGVDAGLPQLDYYNNYRIGLGVEIYSIGYSVDASTRYAREILTRVASSAEDFYYAETDLSDAYDRILESLLYSANNAVVTDVMGAEYDLQFSQALTLGNNMATITLNPAPSIQYGYYNVNSDGSRAGYTEIETITFETNQNGDLAAAYSTLVGAGAQNIYNVAQSKLVGRYITYDLLTETFAWDIGDIIHEEVVLKYFVYLTGSLEGERPEGQYDTNESAVLDYDNYLGKRCRQIFPIPSLGWQEAAVNYEFYLVNEQGHPVDTNGAVVPFSKRVLIGNRQTKTVYLNTANDLNAVHLYAADELPDGYLLFNPDAGYDVSISSGSNPSRAEIIDEGASAVTTYFYNGSHTYNQNGTVPDVTDYTNTNVAFAVVYTKSIIPDAVVIDFGLPVKINVLENDMFTGDDGTLTAIGTGVQAGTELNRRAYVESMLTGVSQTLTLRDGTARIDGTGVIYTPTDMTMDREDVFYYEYLSENGYYYYTTVTVIPAANIYYDDYFLSFTDSPGYAWQTEGSTYNGKLQDEDRPGELNFTRCDANNAYGRDSAYDDDTVTYSLGSSRKVTVDRDSLGKEPKARFTFCGTGFDLFSVTNAETGAVIVEVYNAGTTTRIKNYVVQTYYGYSYDSEAGKFVPNLTAEGGLYQVPVIRSRGLDYGTYDVVITPKYGWIFDMRYDDTGASYNAYDIYVDAVRIYDPAGTAPDASSVIGKAYISDKEYVPKYMEIRDNMLTAQRFYDSDFNSSEVLGVSGCTQGAVFIDGFAALDDTGISDKYLESGPNNELYLARGQAVAFHIVSDRALKPESLQLGMKVVSGGTSTVLALNSSYVKATSVSVSGGTEMYRRLSSYLVWDEAYLSRGIYRTKYPIIFINSSDSIVSFTNFKWTYAEAESSSQAGGLSLAVSPSTPVAAMNAVRSLMLSGGEDEQGAVDLSRVTVSWAEERLQQNTSATLYVTTPTDVVRVTVDGVDITNCSIDGDGNKLWTYSFAVNKAGESSYEVLLYNSDGGVSEPVTTRTITVEAAEEPEKPENPEKPGEPEDITVSLFKRILDLLRSILAFWRSLL